MTSLSPTQASSSRTRSRAKKACKTCNARRVRCNATDEMPCVNCKTADIPCELRVSKRGKYDRHKLRSRTVTMDKRNIPSTSAPIAIDNDEFSKGAGEEKNLEAKSQEFCVNTLQSMRRPSTFRMSPPTSTSLANVLESTVFLGESNSISLVHGTQTQLPASRSSQTDNSRLRYPIPDVVSSKTSATPLEVRRKQSRIDFLVQHGAFTFPSNEVCEVLLSAYFTWFHPCFPILDRHTFWTSYVKRTISPLLFQAVLFVGTSHCNEQIMRELGFPDRHEARSTIYNHAKDIYDADYETDKVIVSQALFLISFWRAGPLLEKDTRHWLGAAISLAQSKGMHRSSSTTSFSDGRLRKRIWWSLYVRDRQCSAALGLPTRIRDEDCDIEMLDGSDFEDDKESSLPNFLGNQTTEHVLYAIQMAKLAIYLGKIVLREFGPTDSPNRDSERIQLQKDLVQWESDLSPEMKAPSTAESFWASMLHLAYNNLYILLYRSAYLGATEGDDPEVGNIALQAACRNTRIIEDVLSQDLVQHGTVHIITSIFNSLCIHTIHLRRSDGTARKLAEYRAQLCLLGLRELQKTWDITNWVLQLFFQFLDQSTAKRLQLADTEDLSSQHEHHADTVDTSGAQQASGLDFATEPSNLQHMTSHLAMPSTPTGSCSSSPSSSIPLTSQQSHKIKDFRIVPFSLDYAAHLFGTKEAEDFSMFQLQPDLFTGDVFNGNLDHYYNSVFPVPNLGMKGNENNEGCR